MKKKEKQKDILLKMLNSNHADVMPELARLSRLQSTMDAMKDNIAHLESIVNIRLNNLPKESAVKIDIGDWAVGKWQAKCCTCGKVFDYPVSHPGCRF